MQDYKQAAEGDRDESNREPSSNYVVTLMRRQEKELAVSLEFAEEALDSLLSWTKGALATPEERTLWIVKLATYSKGKLLTLIDYSGSLNGQVWKYLDNVQVPLPEQTPVKRLSASQPDKEMGRAFFAYVKRLYADGVTPQEQDKIEMDYIRAMREKHPHTTFIPGRGANRGR